MASASDTSEPDSRGQPFARLVLLLSAPVWLGLGLLTTINPDVLANAGVQLDDVGRIEIRAIYGGIELGIGLFLLWSSRLSSRFEPGLVLNALAMGGITVIRLGAMLLDVEHATAFMWSLFASELFGCAFSIVALRQLRR